MDELVGAIVDHLGQYLLVITLGGGFLWLTLNRLTPPSEDMVIHAESPDVDLKPTLRRRRAYSLPACLLCSLLLYLVLFVACLTYMRPPANANLFVLLGKSLVAVPLWYYGSSWAVGLTLRMRTGRLVVMMLGLIGFILIESLIRWASALF